MTREKLMLAKEGDAEFLILESSAKYYPAAKEIDNPTTTQLVEFCDQELENDNRHDFVGVHERLIDVLCHHVSAAKINEIMKDIAEHGGLLGLMQ